MYHNFASRFLLFFFFSSRRRHTRCSRDWSSDVCSSDLSFAEDAFEKLGATLDLRHADELLAAAHDSPSGRPTAAGGKRAVKTFMFTDIVDSTRYAELLGDESWQELIRWHDQTLRSIVAEHGGQEIKTIGDGFFLAFDDVDLAIDAAIAIQRRLVDHRRTQGFALTVRIGIHRAAANRAGLDFSGTGVNAAARIGASASGAEIVVSSDTLAASRRTFRRKAAERWSSREY